jgi:myo-inositol 2-dehydrogenase/D-chiro-inositol 1-dehydrogenase
MRRFDKGYINAKKLLHEGAIGTLRRVHLVTGDYPPPGAGFIPKSGGIFKDCTIHDIDALRWVTGHQVNEVYAIGSAVGAPYFAANGDADEAVGTMTMDDGTFVTFQVSRNNGAGYDIRMELAGEKDTLSVGFDSYLALTSAEPEFNFSEAGERYPNFYPRFTKAYQSEIAQFVDAVAAGAPSPAPIQDALEALFVCEALNVSRVEHRPVRVDEIRSANGVMRPEQY